VKAIGHGQRSSLSRSEALDVAKASTPQASEILASDADLKGKTVRVAATDYGRDPITGAFAGSTPYSLTLARDVDGLGQINVHVPRLGYSLSVA